MSLQTRLTDLVAAIGADVKYLMNKKPWTGMVWTVGVPAATSSGTGIAFIGTATPGYTAPYTLTAAAGDYVIYRGDIAPGTYTLRAFYVQLTNTGIVDIDYSLDEGATWTNIATNLDTYAAAAGSNLYVDKAGVVVGQSQPTIMLRWTNRGKNASASNAVMVICPMMLIRTA